MYFDKETDFNFLTNTNEAKLLNCSSQTKGCYASNTLNGERKSIWLSETSIPQYIIYDLCTILNKPRQNFRYFGFYCWHAYATNPKSIELHFSKDNKNYQFFGKYEFELKPGTQFVEIKNNKNLELNNFRYFKILIKETFGGNRTYLNQVYLLEDISKLSPSKNTNKPRVVNIGKRRSESPNLIISNLSQNMNEEEFQQDKQHMLPKFDEKKNSHIEMREENDCTYDQYEKYGNDPLYDDESQINNRNCYSEIQLDKNRKLSRSGKSINLRNKSELDQSVVLNYRKPKNIYNSDYFQPSENEKNNYREKDRFCQVDKQEVKKMKKTHVSNINNFKYDNYEGSISETEKDYKSDNFLVLKKTLSPLKKELNNRSQSPRFDNEYKILENQIKEMEIQINSMNSDYNINRCFNSKSFLYKKNEHDKNQFYRNPFIDNHTDVNNQNTPQDFKTPNIIKTDSKGEHKRIFEEKNCINYNEKQINTNNSNNLPERQTELVIDRSNKKELNTISYSILQEGNYGKMLNNLNSLNKNNMNHVNIEDLKNLNQPNLNINLENNIDEDGNYGYKLKNMENKLEKMEIDIIEIKENFGKLYESILRLIEFASSRNFYPSNFQNNIKKEIFQTQNENLYTNREYISNLNNLNEIDNSQRLNTQNSKISNSNNNFIQQGINSQSLKNTYNNSITNSNNDVLNFILNECNKLKNQNLHEFSENNGTSQNYNYNYNNFNNFNENQDVNYVESPRNYKNEVLMNTHLLNMPYSGNFNGKKSSNVVTKKFNNLNGERSFNPDDEDNYSPNFNQDFENKLLKKIEDKIESMASNVELRMVNNFLKPSIQSIENNMKMNINEIKSKISNINTMSDNNNKNYEQDESKLQDSSLIKSSSNRNENAHMDTKISEINRLGERLYEKLLEKEKKLNELKNETTSYLKKKINNNTNTTNNLMNSES